MFTVYCACSPLHSPAYVTYFQDAAPNQGSQPQGLLPLSSTARPNKWVVYLFEEKRDVDGLFTTLHRKNLEENSRGRKWLAFVFLLL